MMRKKSFLIIVVVILSHFSFSQITNYPYSEDFENGAGGFTAYGTASSWELGAPANSFIDDAASGQNAWVTNLDGAYAVSEVSYLQSPYFDFSSMIGVPTLLFSHIFNIEVQYDNSWVEYTLDSGATWTKLGVSGSGVNWYNVAGSDVWDGTSVTTGEWRQAVYPMNVLQGESSVAFRFVMNSDFSLTYEGVGVDDFTIAENPVDFSVASIVAPQSGCALSATDTLTVNVTSNIGTVQGFDLCYEFQGNSICETFTDTIQEGNTQSVTFASTLNLSTPGVYELTVSLVNQSGDVVSSNDTFTASISSIPVLNELDLPYFEDFEAGRGAWTSSGDALWEWGNPAASYIDTAASGQNAWVTNLDGNYNNNMLAYLSSPCIDFSNVSGVPVLQFAQIFNSEEDYDGTWLEYTTDGGVSWQKLGASGLGLNWYNNPFDEWWDAQSDPNGNWRNAFIALDSLVGSSEARLRFVFSSDGSNTEEGMGIDDIKIQLDPIDYSLNALLSPASKCASSDTESVSVAFEHLLGDTLFGFSLCYQIAGNVPICETFPDTISRGEIVNITFQNKADLSLPGIYDIKVYHAEGSDFSPLNDTLRRMVSNKPFISNYPYFQDFENFRGFFDASGTRSSWEYGVPVGIPSSSPGSNVWGTNLSGNYNDNEDSYLESNCFDFSSFTDIPKLSFDINYSTESCCDEGWLEYSIDGGVVWNKLNGSNSTNWYNDLGNAWWDGTSGGWVNASTEMPGLQGEDDVRFRFVFSSDGSATENGFYIDNFLIFTDLLDAGITNVELPEPDCNQSASVQLSGVYNNYGTDSIYGYQVCYSLNAATTVCENFVDTVPPGAVDTFNFSATLDLSAPGAYDVVVYSTLNNDFRATNDTFRTSTLNKENISVYPFKEDFENGAGSWASLGTNSSWQLGTPQNAVIQGAASGQNAWVTALNGPYNNNENSAVLSPCFDFSGQNAELWIGMNLWWESEGGYDGAVLQYSVDSQNTWNNIGAFGDPFKWYNDDDISAEPGGSLEGWAGDENDGSGTYVWVQSLLDTAVVNNDNVLFRIAFASDGSVNYDGVAFDDFAIGELPDLEIISDTSVCSGAVVQTNVPSLQHLWSNGDTTNSIVLTNLDTVARTDTLFVQVENNFGFVALDTLVVEVLPGPYFELGSDTNLCYNECITVGAESRYSQFAWNTGENSDSITVCAPNSRAYILNATSNYSNCTFTDSIEIQFTSPLDLGSDRSFCEGDSLVFELDSTKWQSVVWVTLGDSSYSTVVNSSIALEAEVTDSVGCSSSDTVMITEYPTPVIALDGDTTICDNASIILGTSNQAPGLDFSWTLNNQLVGNTPQIAVSEAGNYTLEITTPNGCSNSGSQTVTVENCIGIDDLSNNNELTIYPNPSSGNISITLEGKGEGELTLVISDISGKQLYAEVFKKNAQVWSQNLDLSELNKGIYFISISDKNSVINRKITIQ